MTLVPSSATTLTRCGTELLITRFFAAPRALVWAAWTDPQRLPLWMTGPAGWTMPVCELDLRPGGAWRYGWQNSDGETMEMCGTFLEIVAPERLVTTERWGGTWPETRNTLLFTDHNGETRLELRTRYPSPEALEAAVRTGMESGLTESFDRLATLLQTGDAR